jgi:hypothetical protein
MTRDDVIVENRLELCRVSQQRVISADRKRLESLVARRKHCERPLPG